MVVQDVADNGGGVLQGLVQRERHAVRGIVVGGAAGGHTSTVSGHMHPLASDGQAETLSGFHERGHNPAKNHARDNGSRAQAGVLVVWVVIRHPPCDLSLLDD